MPFQTISRHKNGSFPYEGIGGSQWKFNFGSSRWMTSIDSGQ